MSSDREQPPVQDLAFEDAYRELEETVQRLDAGDLTLEEAIALYERGMALAQRCGDTLDAAELQVEEVAATSGQQGLGPNP